MLNWLKRFFIKSSLGTIIHDYGVFSELQSDENKKQILKLLLCEKDKKRFFVIQTYKKSRWSFAYQWYKLSEQELFNLRSILNDIKSF